MIDHYRDQLVECLREIAAEDAYGELDDDAQIFVCRPGGPRDHTGDPECWCNPFVFVLHELRDIEALADRVLRGDV